MLDACALEAFITEFNDKKTHCTLLVCISLASITFMGTLSIHETLLFCKIEALVFCTFSASKGADANAMLCATPLAELTLVNDTLL